MTQSSLHQTVIISLQKTWNIVYESFFYDTFMVFVVSFFFFVIDSSRFPFTFIVLKRVHLQLSDIFIQSDLQCIQAIHFFVSVCVPWELNPQPLRC